MNQLQQFSQLPFSHHAYGIESTNSIYGEIEKNITKDDFSYIINKKYDMLKIADAREIKSLQYEKTDKPSLFVLEFSFINREAQNALLKVLEEPSSNTYFILVFPDRSKILSTLLSRLHMVSYVPDQDFDNNFVSVVEFKSLSLQKRFELIKTKTDKKKDDVISKKDVLIFLDELEYIESEKDIPSSQLLETFFLSRNSLHANGASMKMVLDMIALHV